MEEEILRNLPKNWNVFILNGNATLVSSSIRKHIRQLNPNLSKSRRSRNSKSMVVLFYFTNGCKSLIVYHPTYTYERNLVEKIRHVYGEVTAKNTVIRNHRPR